MIKIDGMAHCLLETIIVHDERVMFKRPRLGPWDW